MLNTIEHKNNSIDLVRKEYKIGYSPFVDCGNFARLYVTVTVCARINHNTPAVALTY